jgi:hypothetical protein
MNDDTSSQAGQQLPEDSPPAAHPPTTVVQVTRPLDPIHPSVSDETMRRHTESAKRFPHLNLSTGEFVISAVTRHPIGLVRIWGLVGLLIASLFAVVALFTSGGEGGATAISSGTKLLLYIGAVFLSAIFLLGAVVASYVYENNRFYLTNESVVQEIQTSLFARNEQTVSLLNIEDASYRQDGIIAHLFNYGSIRLSTEGDETTYRFNYVSNPKHQIALLNNAVEAFKNGRPVVTD